MSSSLGPAEGLAADFLGIELVSNLAQQCSNFAGVVICGVAAVTKISTAAVQEFDEVFHNHRHVFSTFTTEATGGGIQHPDAQCLGTTLALSHAELNPRTRFHHITVRKR